MSINIKDISINTVDDLIDAALGHLSEARRAWQQNDREVARLWCDHAVRVWCNCCKEDRAAVYRALREELEGALEQEVRLARWLEVWPAQMQYLREGENGKENRSCRL